MSGAGYEQRDVLHVVQQVRAIDASVVARLMKLEAERAKLALENGEQNT